MTPTQLIREFLPGTGPVWVQALRGIITGAGIAVLVNGIAVWVKRICEWLF
jgi:hypothetical protein